MADPLDVRKMSASERVGEGMRRSLPLLSPQARAAVAQLLEPGTLAIVAGVLVAWIGSHAIGIGEIIDVILISAGAIAIGLAVFEGIDHLLDFGHLTLNARSESDLDAAGHHFAAAVTILGIQAVLAILLRWAPKSFRGGRVDPGPIPKALRTGAKPRLSSTRSLPAGAGETSWWGEIVISRLGTVADRRLAALHESVHRALSPRLNLLRRFRVQGRGASYSNSSLSAYLEEALAETVAQVGVNGLRSAFSGLAFPVRNGYVTLMRPALVNGEKIMPFIPEAGGLLASGILIAGHFYQIWWSPKPPVPR